MRILKVGMTFYTSYIKGLRRQQLGVGGGMRVSLYALEIIDNRTERQI